MVASQPLLATLAELLEAHGLERLVETLHEKASLADLQSRLASNRPLMLAHLKAIGVDRLGDRQALANALSKSEKSGQIAAAVPIAQLRPPIFDEDDDALTVKLKLPPHVSSNQLKMRVDANSLRVELCGEATACCGKLHALVRPSDCTWELERSPRPEYDPLASASDQPAPEDTMVISLRKAEPGRWTTLFADATAKRYVPPVVEPPPESEDAKARRLALDLKKRDALHGVGFVQRTYDPRGERQSAEATARRAREQRAAEPQAASTPTAPARDHWPGARAVLLWRDGASPRDGCPSHSADSEPFFRWVEERDTLVISASTRRDLDASEIEMRATRSSVECFVSGLPTPWRGALVGHIEPSKCSLQVVPSAQPDAISDTLRLTLVKADANRLVRSRRRSKAPPAPAHVLCPTERVPDHLSNAQWRAPWPELLKEMDLRDQRSHRRLPRRDEMLVGGYDHAQHADGLVEVVVPFKSGFEWLTHDELRVALASDAINVHVAGQEEAPMLAGQLHGKIDVARCSWSVRAAEARGSMQIEEIVIRLRKAAGHKQQWHDLLKVAYV